MDNFVVSARKYRPITFDTVVGQSSITTTLKNAISNNHMAQAFLFCGSRGVGKTTCARILAKVINCTNITDKVEPCGQCESCKSFEQGQSLNIYELDAASNNSVDDIRHLIDQVRFAPQMGDYKVYIIDEVHMLSQAAFNAFLKTLEEPPAHAVFILATTEKHKIIPTILSRCQIFDFHRIQVRDIADHLGNIAKTEGISAEPDALHIIAQKADGALRDALSIFDQLVSFAGKEITYKAVIENLNILDYDYYFKVTDAILASDTSTCLLVFNEILNNGFDGHNFITGLAEHFRNLLVCKDAATLQLLEVGDQVKARYSEQAASVSAGLLIGALKVASDCDISYKSSKNQRLLVELTLLKLTSLALEKKSPDVSDSDEIALIPPGTAIAEFISNQSVSPKITKPAAAAPVAAPLADSAPASNGTAPPHTVSDAPPPRNAPPVRVASAAALHNTIKTKGPSIMSMLHDEVKPGADSEEDAEPDYSNKPADPFDQDTFLELWHSYAASVKLQGKNSLFSTMKKRDPVVQSDFSIALEIDNDLQNRDLNSEKPALMAHLREKLNNWSIQLVTTIVEQIEGQKLYTPRDKYLRMAEKNPKLNDLKQKLDLDIDY